MALPKWTFSTQQPKDGERTSNYQGTFLREHHGEAIPDWQEFCLSEGAITRPINVIATSGLEDKLKRKYSSATERVNSCQGFLFLFVLQKEKEYSCDLLLKPPASSRKTIGGRINIFKREIPELGAVLDGSIYLGHKNGFRFMIQHPTFEITPEICAAFMNYTVVKGLLIHASTYLEN